MLCFRFRFGSSVFETEVSRREVLWIVHEFLATEFRFRGCKNAEVGRVLERRRRGSAAEKLVVVIEFLAGSVLRVAKIRNPEMGWGVYWRIRISFEIGRVE